MLIQPTGKRDILFGRLNNHAAVFIPAFVYLFIVVVSRSRSFHVVIVIFYSEYTEECVIYHFNFIRKFLSLKEE